MAQIFISYRHEDDPNTREHIYNRLITHFGAENIFIEKENTIPVSSLRGKVIKSYIRKSNIMLVLIGPKWQRITQELVPNSEDNVCFEIEFALDTHKCRVIPVLLDGAGLPTQLPTSIETLSQQKYFYIREEPHFHDDINVLIKSIKGYTVSPLLSRWKVGILLLVVVISIIAAMTIFGTINRTESEAAISTEAAIRSNNKPSNDVPSKTPPPETLGTAQDTPIVSPLLEAISNADVENGERLALATGCIGCHSADISELVIVGPPLHNILGRAAERVEGQDAYTYLYDSIVNPEAYIVEGYPSGIMPLNYFDFLNEDEVYDIIAYLATLNSDTVVNKPTPFESPTPTSKPIAPRSSLRASVNNADANNGELLFIMQGCLGCHTTDSSEMMIVGPPLYNILERAGERVEGQDAYTYLYNSIVNPNEHIVEGYVSGVMPPSYLDFLTEDEVYDIIAYLLTLGD